MVTRMKKIAYVTAISAGLGLMAPLSAIAQDQDHHDHDYHDQNGDMSNNRYYQMGAKEGKKDHDKNHRKEHHHKFSKDDDRRAYQSGYENAWQGDQNHGHENH